MNLSKVKSNLTLLGTGGGGWFPLPLPFFFNCSKFHIDTIPRKLLTFNICPFAIFWSKKNSKFFGGTPLLAPQKFGFSQKKI